jgi:hypothetical protein
LQAPGTGSTLADDAARALGNGGTVNLDKQELVRMLRTQGDNDTADKVDSRLPDQIDTDRDGDALDGLGLDRTQLMAKLAGGGFGQSLAP